jgi:hypothetical protein
MWIPFNREIDFDEPYGENGKWFVNIYILRSWGGQCRYIDSHNAGVMPLWV